MLTEVCRHNTSLFVSSEVKILMNFCRLEIILCKLQSYAEDLAKTPGPARYGATENNNYLKRQPQESGRNRSGAVFGY